MKLQYRTILQHVMFKKKTVVFSSGNSNPVNITIGWGIIGSVNPKSLSVGKMYSDILEQRTSYLIPA